MFISNKNCSGIGECIKECPTDSIRLINGKAFSCITCGKCEEVCPNSAVFQNKYKGYVVDRSKCNGCGICEFNCPVNAIKIEDGVTKGICARCGICTDYCPEHARIDGFDLVEENQLKYLKSLNLAIPNAKTFTSQEKDSSRNCVTTDLNDCILCGRCDYYCPTNAIIVKNDQEGFCTSCRVCSDLCPADAIEKGVIDNSKCVLCLDCIKNCPNKAIIIKERNDFELEIKKPNDTEITGSIVSCLNCGLCAENCESGALKQVNGKIRYSPKLCLKCDKETCISICPVQTLRIDNYTNIEDININSNNNNGNNSNNGNNISINNNYNNFDRNQDN
ncbi:MAG: 4Fe-4S binding protein, partial [Methanobacteriaceae archaeon]